MKENAAQNEAFQKTARELGVDESEDALDRAMGKLDIKRKPEAEKQKEAKDE